MRQILVQSNTTTNDIVLSTFKPEFFSDSLYNTLSLDDIPYHININKDRIKNILSNHELEFRGIGLNELLQLSFYQGGLEDILKLNIQNLSDYTFNIQIASPVYDKLEVDIDLVDNTLTIHSISLNNNYRGKYGLGIRGFVNQVNLAKKFNFDILDMTFAAGNSEEFTKSPNIEDNGYFYRPMLGFLANEESNHYKDMLNIIKQSKDSKIKGCNSINELFLLEDDFGNRIGIDFWKEYGEGLGVYFDLKPNSLSLQLLGEYLDKKRDTKPEYYSDIVLI